MLLRTSLLSTLLFLPLVASGNDLMRVYDQAVHNDKTIEAARHARDAALQATPQARAVLLPQLRGNYDYGYSDTHSTVSGFPSSHNHGVNETASVSLSQSLFNLGNWRRLQQADAQVALAQNTYRSAEQTLVLNVAQAYFGVLGSRDNLRSARAEHDAVQRQLEQAQKRFDVGLSAITDVQEAQARYDLTVAQRILAQQQLDTATLALRQITGQPVERASGLQEDIPLPTPDPADIQQWVKYAMDSNLDLRGAELGYDIARRDVQAQRAQHLPTVDLTASYSDSSRDAGAFPQDSTGTSVGVGVTLPIFSGGATQASVRQSIATREQRQAEMEGVQRQVDRDTRSAYLGAVTGAAQVKAYKQAVISSKTALDASQTGLEVGTRTNVDVLNAQQQLYAAERNYLQSRYDYLIAVLQLKAAAGRLTPADLKQIDTLLVAGEGGSGPVAAAPTDQPQQGDGAQTAPADDGGHGQGGFVIQPGH